MNTSDSDWLIQESAEQSNREHVSFRDNSYDWVIQNNAVARDNNAYVSFVPFCTKYYEIHTVTLNMKFKYINRKNAPLERNCVSMNEQQHVDTYKRMQL